MLFKRILFVLLSFTWLICSCSDSKKETIKIPTEVIQDSTLINFKKSKLEIKSFDDLEKHLNHYKSLWKSMGINWDYANDVIVNLNTWSKNGKIKNISDKDILAIINDLPPQGDLRGMVFDLWKESKIKN